MNEKVVDYLDLIARAASENRAERDVESVLPEPAGSTLFDLASTKA